MRLESGCCHYLVLILHSGLNNVPCHCDCLIAQVDDMFIDHTWVNEDVIAVRFVLVCCYVKRVVAFVQFRNREGTVVTCLACCYDCTRCRMAYSHLGTLHVRLLFSVIGIFITHIDKQFTSAYRNRFNHERQWHTLTVLAVDSDGATLRYVQLHVSCWCESQHNLGCIVRSQ